MAVLELKGIHKAFGGLVAVDDVSFTVRQGTIHGLIGPNGAGKTTLFSLITGFYQPTRGRVELDGVDLGGLSTSARARRGLVRTFQGTVLFPEQSVEENIRNGMLASQPAGWRDWLGGAGGGSPELAAREEEIIEFTQLGAIRRSMARSLSHGQQRVLGIAVALAARPRVLLLDEPFTGMTAGEKDRLSAILVRIRETGTTVVLVEHDMRTVMRLCDTVTVLNFGRVLTEGTPDHVRRHPDVMAAYLGTAA